MTSQKTWQHDELATDLAKHLRANSDRMVWENMQLGPSGTYRPDVYTLNKSFARPSPHAYEIKISVSDYRSDITSGKWQKYLAAAGAVTFAVPQGLITKADLPKGCGLIVRSDKGWTTSKGATFGRCELNQDTCMKLLISGLQRLQETNEPRKANAWLVAETIRKKLGHEVAGYLTNTESSRKRLEGLHEEEDKLRKSINVLQSEYNAKVEQYKKDALADLDKESSFIQHPLNILKEALNIKDLSHWQVAQHLRELNRIASDDARLKLAMDALESAKSAIDHQISNLNAIGGLNEKI